MTNNEKQQVLDALNTRLWNWLAWLAKEGTANFSMSDLRNTLTCLEIISVLREELPLGDEE